MKNAVEKLLGEREIAMLWGLSKEELKEIKASLEELK